MKLSKILSIMAISLGCLSACGESQADKEDTGAKCNAGEVVINNIMTRTSIRQFTDRQVSKDTLDIIVKAGMAAPSAMNKQPWAFVVITEKNMLDSLNAKHPYANLKTATAAIVVCGNMEKTIEGEGKEYWVQDCSAASENILLAAHGLGLGAVWCGVYPVAERIKDISAVLSLPESIVPLNIITMGYPAEQPEPKDKFNADNVYYQKW